ncbi:cobalamin-dependent protein [Actinomadura harenae]|uniref:B12-binding domain-containing protein n=1 Tax=Actinomadura harenae TaxID=2483351 RepID=A0A3M2LLB3_9ACTN|nr:cobalamin-dependent protein [Actinomadura harenae]RMI37916.1 hypothetical protein EBO15_34475 [Actinomadura harenae]
MRIVLATLPWAPVDVPSPALDALASAVASRRPGDDVEVVHANADFHQWVAERRPFTIEDYGYYSAGSRFDGRGDWVFSSALHGVPGWRADEFDASMGGTWTAHQRDLGHALHALAPAFVDRLARRVVDAAPDLVGFTSTFQQNTASLATARRVKELNPAIRTVLGGANCDGVQGAALHRNFPAVDFVVRGEGAVVFAELVGALADGGDLAPIPGLCWRDRNGVAHANPASTRPANNGATGCVNVRTIRDAASAGIRPTWNYIYGFPGEDDADHLPVLEQFPALHHLPPPMGASRIAAERPDPYFDRPVPGFTDLRPAAHYQIIYDLPERELFALAHPFRAPEQGIGEETIARLESAVDIWRSEHPGCRLVHWDTGGGVRFSNSRPQFPWSEFTVADPFGLALLRLLHSPRGLPSLVKRLTADLGVNVTHAEVRQVIDRWKALGLVFHDRGRYIHVATTADDRSMVRFIGP